MNYVLSGNNFNHLYHRLYNEVMTHGQKSKPRNMGITEVIGYQFCLTDPSQALCTIKERKLNYAFALIEALEYLRGVSEPTRLCFYNSKLSSFINENNQFDGSYGPRIATQLPYVLKLLQDDKDTRQAVITLRDSRDCRVSKDIPCTLSLQFLLREGALHCITTMRSNDLLWGTPYDVHGFTFIQRHLALLLGVNVGTYIHQAGSLHIYDSTKEDWEFIKSIGILNDVKIPLLRAKTITELYELIDVFFDWEAKTRAGQTCVNMRPELNSYCELISNYIAKKLNK